MFIAPKFKLYAFDFYELIQRSLSCLVLLKLLSNFKHWIKSDFIISVVIVIRLTY